MINLDVPNRCQTPSEAASLASAANDRCDRDEYRTYTEAERRERPRPEARRAPRERSCESPSISRARGEVRVRVLHWCASLAVPRHPGVDSCTVHDERPQPVSRGAQEWPYILSTSKMGEVHPSGRAGGGLQHVGRPLTRARIGYSQGRSGISSLTKWRAASTAVPALKPIDVAGRRRRISARPSPGCRRRRQPSGSEETVGRRRRRCRRCPVPVRQVWLST